jgi:hypothetical protein
MGNARGLGGLGCAAALACALLACGSGDTQPPAATPAAPAAPAAPTPSAGPAPSLEERLAKLASLYEWDAARGEARALGADVAECDGKIVSEGLVGVAEHIRCMEALGWSRKPGA